MENAQHKKFIIHFIGYSCTGKTSLEKALKEKLPGVYSVCYDKQKWQLAGYERVKDSKLIRDITAGLFEVVCKIGNPILLLSPIDTESDYVKYKDIATLYGYSFISIELTAPKDVLLERFRLRVKTVKEKGVTISVTDENVFLNNLSKTFFTPKDKISFDTSLVSTDYISDEVIKLLPR